MPSEPTARARWRGARLPLVAGTVVLLAALLAAAVAGRFPQGKLDPHAVDPAGSRALAVLLEARGVAVHRVRGLASAPATGWRGGTIFVPFPDLLPDVELRRLSAQPGGAVVVVDPLVDTLRRLTAAIRAGASSRVAAREPHCSYPPALIAGNVELGGGAYLPADSAVQRCYGGHLAAATTAGGAPLVVVGAPDPFTNDRLDKRGNAALAVGLLDQRTDLWWVLPAPAAASESGTASLVELLPRWVVPVAGEILLAVLLLALWRGRRLGPVVSEPLPVVVRAAETVEGRARLYQRAHARERAAPALQAGARHRLAGPLGLGADPAPAALVAAVARRTGRPETAVGELLFAGESRVQAGGDPALVRLADALDDLVASTVASTVARPDRPDREGRSS